MAPAGSGKTTTRVARIAWLVATGAEPSGITAVTFNKRAADEMTSRVDAALEPLGLAPGTVRVKAFHALAREILRDGGESVEPLLDREAVLRDMWPDISRGAVRRLDDAFSRLKLDVGVTAAQVATDPSPGPIARAFLAYERALDDSGGLDFDDLIVRALALLEARPPLLRRWRERCGHLLVDETQDVDRSQLKLALLLAAPHNRIFLVGDDDQTIYGWRLADVRRVLALSDSLPGLRRLDLTVNYRCPPEVIRRAVRLVANNRERFGKQIRPGPANSGSLVTLADSSDDTERARRILTTWPDDGGSRAILARTNAELLPCAAVALEMGLAFRATRLRFLTEDARIDELIRLAEGAGDERPFGLLPSLVRLARHPPELLDPPPAERSDPDLREEAERLLPFETPELIAALVSWAPAYERAADLRVAVASHRARLAELRREDAPLTLATVHSTKGLEFDHVAVIGLDAGRFPSARSLRESTEPERALEEERRLAYVAWTRARRSLTLVFDPASPSQFLLEAFDCEELGLAADDLSA